MNPSADKPNIFGGTACIPSNVALITEIDAMSSGSVEGGGLLSAPLKNNKDLLLRGEGVSTIKRVDEEEAEEL
jgi:hypothetical protein